MRFYFDMDGSLAEWRQGGRIYEKNYFRSLKPNKSLLNAARLLIEQGKDVYILTCYLSDSVYAKQEKQDWIAEYLPEIDEAHRIFVPCGENKFRYVRSDDGIGVLVDDYNVNLQAWAAAGGKAVKFLNGINSETSWPGRKVRHTDAPEKIAKELLSV